MKKKSPPAAAAPVAATPAPAPRWLFVLVLLFAGWHLLAAGWVVANNLAHPAIINGSEGEHAQFAYQAAAGLRLYGPLDVHVRELWYTPLTFQLAGLASRPFGYSVRVMRLTIVAFSCGAIALLGWIVRRLTGSTFLAWVGACLFSGLEVTTPWFIALDPNAVHVFFAVLALALLLRDPALRWGTVVLATAALFGSYWSKHTGLAYVAAGVFYLLLKDVRKGLAAAALAALLVGGSAWYYIRQPGSSFVAMLMMHGRHPMVWKWFAHPYLFPEVFGRFLVLAPVVLLGVLGLLRRPREWVRPEYVFLGASAVVGTLARLKYGSGPTQGIFFNGMLIACGLMFLRRWQTAGRLGATTVLVLLGVQSLALVHDVRGYLIHAEDDARYRELLAWVGKPGKNVYYINQGIYNVLAGKTPYTAVGRDCWHNGQIDRSLYPAAFREAFGKDPFDIVIIDIPTEINSWFLYERLQANYVPVAEMPAITQLPAGVTLRNRKLIFYRKDQVPQPSVPPG